MRGPRPGTWGYSPETRGLLDFYELLRKQCLSVSRARLSCTPAYHMVRVRLMVLSDGTRCVNCT
jgi:hypothetical protein